MKLAYDFYFVRFNGLYAEEECIGNVFVTVSHCYQMEDSGFLPVKIGQTFTVYFFKVQRFSFAVVNILYSFGGEQDSLLNFFRLFIFTYDVFNAASGKGIKVFFIEPRCEYNKAHPSAAAGKNFCGLRKFMRFNNGVFYNNDVAPLIKRVFNIIKSAAFYCRKAYPFISAEQALKRVYVQRNRTEEKNINLTHQRPGLFFTYFKLNNRNKNYKKKNIGNVQT